MTMDSDHDSGPGQWMNPGADGVCDGTVEGDEMRRCGVAGDHPVAPSWWRNKGHGHSREICGKRAGGI
jgi:hypothetical protein